MKTKPISFTSLTIFTSTILFSLFVSCTPEIGNIINKRISREYTNSESVKVYFATNRKVEGQPNECSNNIYTSNYSEQIRFGECVVNVPARHPVGALDFDPRGDQNQFFKFLGQREWPQPEFESQFLKDETIIFVHGFNVPFEEAILRAAQIQYDLKFPGNVVLYTWPAGANQNSLLPNLYINEVYANNYKSAIASREHFRKFIELVLKQSPKVHLVVHSMGHQVVLPVVSNLKNGKLAELVLNAPDMDDKDFTSLKDGLVNNSKRVTLYCSPGDNALVASEKVNGGVRVGMCRKYKDIDVINVNEVDAPIVGLGHGYYSSRPILTDIYQVLLGVDVRKRLFIRASGPTNGEDFVLRK